MADEDFSNFIRIERSAWGLVAFIALWAFLAFFYFLFVFIFDKHFELTFLVLKLLGLALFAFLLLSYIYMWIETKYYVNETTLVIKKLFKIRRYPVIQGRQLSIRQGFLQRILGYGTVVIGSEQAGNNITISSVKDPYGLVQKVKMLSDEQEKKSEAEKAQIMYQTFAQGAQAQAQTQPQQAQVQPQPQPPQAQPQFQQQPGLYSPQDIQQTQTQSNIPEQTQTTLPDQSTLQYQSQTQAPYQTPVGTSEIRAEQSNAAGTPKYSSPADWKPPEDYYTSPQSSSSTSQTETPEKLSSTQHEEKSYEPSYPGGSYYHKDETSKNPDNNKQYPAPDISLDTTSPKDTSEPAAPKKDEIPKPDSTKGDITRITI